MLGADHLEVLDALGVRHIVQVDDANVQAWEFDALWERCATVTPQAWLALGIDVAGMPEDVARRAVERHWESIAEPKQLSFAGAALAAAGLLSEEEQALDLAVQGRLAEFFAGDGDKAPKFHRLTLTEWRHQRETFVAAAATETTLFLFDLNFERESADKKYGLELVKEFAENTHMLLGLVTHSTSIEDEPLVWAKYSTETSVARDRFVVLSKERLGGESPMGANLGRFPASADPSWDSPELAA